MLINVRSVIRITTVAFIICAIDIYGYAQQPPTIEEIIDGIAQSEDLFFSSDSLLMRYERTDVSKLIPESKLSGQLLAKWTMAYKADKWLNERQFTHPKKTKEFMVPSAPTRQVVKEKHIVEWNQESKSATVDRFNEGQNVYSGLFYTKNLSFDAPKHIARINGADITAIRKVPGYKDDTALPFLPDFLKDNKSNYRVMPMTEKIDGVPCWVVEWPIWIVFGRSKSRLCHSTPRVSLGTGKPRRSEFRNSDYREVKTGLWLPFTQVEDVYASPIADKQSIWGKMVSRCTYRVHSIEFDRVPDNLFDIELPPDTRVVDIVREFRYSVSGKDDAEPFSAAISEAKKLRARSLLLYWFLGSGSLLLVVFSIFWYRSRRTRRVP